MYTEISLSGIMTLVPALLPYPEENDLIPVIFFHGFTGSKEDWSGIMGNLPEEFYPMALDLPGHGKSLFPSDSPVYSTGGLQEIIFSIIRSFLKKKPVLAGYSMGGRAALSFAARYPDYIGGLFLESTTPGIIDENERMQRIQSDEFLAQRIEKDMKDFMEYWMGIPLFESQKSLPDSTVRAIKEKKLGNDPSGLASSLRGFGTGVMPHLWDEIINIKCPVCLVTGSLDKKFTAISQQAVDHFPIARHITVEKAGHNIHLEKPEVFLHLLKDFLITIKK